MNKNKWCNTIYFSITMLFLVLSQRAFAYLDPGTGSFLFQMIAATVLGGLFAIKIFWKKIKFFFKNLFFSNEQ